MKNIFWPKNKSKMAEKSKMAAVVFTLLSISTYPFVFIYMSKREKYCSQ